MTRTTVMALLMSVALPLGALAQTDGSSTDATATGQGGSGESGATVGETPTSTGTLPAPVATTDESATGQSGTGESGDSVGTTPTAVGTEGAPVPDLDDSSTGTSGTGESGTTIGESSDDGATDTTTTDVPAPVTGVIVTTTPGTAPAADAPAADAPAADAPAAGAPVPPPAAPGAAPMPMPMPAPGAAPTTAPTPSSDASGSMPAPMGDMKTAEATVATADGTDVGSVSLMATESGAIHVMLDLGNLSEGVRAVHIHETGACDGPTFESAGAHLSGGHAHGIHSPEGMHLGDLPNVTVAPDGTVKAEFFKNDVTMDDELDSDGSAFVIHTGQDDYTTQPSGASGDRLACGVIQSTRA